MSDFNKLLKEIRQTNLCTWYLLPLTGLNKFSFGDGIFINSYLDPKKNWVIVHVPDLNLVRKKLVSYAIKSWSNDRGAFLAYQILPLWNEDVACYIVGTYSQFSRELKDVICTSSGLPYRQPDGKGGFITDIRLMALEDREELKQYLRDELNVYELPAELLLKPSAESFMDVEEVQ